MSWLYNLIGIVFLGIIFEIILPNNKINKFIKCIFSIFIVFSLISPLVKISSKINKIKIDNVSSEINEELFQTISDLRKNTYETLITKSLENDEIFNVKIDIEFDVEKSNMQINKITIDLANLVLTENSKNINKYEVITKHVKKYLDISEDKIIFNE